MANQASIYLESTAVAVSRRVGSMVGLLSRTGFVDEVTQQAVGGKPVVVRFTMTVEGRALEVELRPDVEAVRRQHQRFKPNSSQLVVEQYERIAWGQLEEWLKIQIALIEGGSHDPVTAFMSRVMVLDEAGRRLSLGEQFRSQYLALPAPEKAEAA